MTNAHQGAALAWSTVSAARSRTGAPLAKSAIGSLRPSGSAEDDDLSRWRRRCAGRGGPLWRPHSCTGGDTGPRRPRASGPARGSTSHTARNFPGSFQVVRDLSELLSASWLRFEVFGEDLVCVASFTDRYFSLGPSLKHRRTHVQEFQLSTRVVIFAGGFPKGVWKSRRCWAPGKPSQTQRYPSGGSRTPVQTTDQVQTRSPGGTKGPETGDLARDVQGGGQGKKVTTGFRPPESAPSCALPNPSLPPLPAGKNAAGCRAAVTCLHGLPVTGVHLNESWSIYWSPGPGRSCGRALDP